MSRVTIRDKAHWHELRAPRIGASDVPSLFDVGYRSKFELWHEKKGTLAPADLDSDERVVLGKHLEHGIAGAAGELFGITLQPCDYYLIDDQEPRLGATLDFLLVDGSQTYPAEVKNQSWGSWKDHWIVHEDGWTEPPLRFELQLQAQLACANAERGLLLALISGDRLVRYTFERHESAISAIRERVAQFWQSIESNEPPPAEMPGDLHAAKRVWAGGDGFADLRGDPDIEQWLEQVANLRADRKRIDDALHSVEGELLAYCTKNQFASIEANAGRVSCKEKPATAERMVAFKAQPKRIELRVTAR